jgi:hypothetical protein
MSFRSVVAIAGALAFVAPLSAQQPQGTADSATVAVVLLDGSQKPIEGAEVRVGSALEAVRTDFMGAASVKHPRNSSIRLTIRHQAYAPIDTTFPLGDADWQLMLIAQPSSPRLPTTTVSAAPTAPRPHLAGFEARRAQGKGRYITPEELAKTPERKLNDMLARLGGLVIDNGPQGQGRVLARSGPQSFVGSGGGAGRGLGEENPGVKPGHCVVSVFVDGSIMPGIEMGSLRAGEFDAVEYYTITNMPPEYKRPGVTCGVLLLWSK